MVIPAAEAAHVLVEAWYSGKNANERRTRLDPTSNDDGSGWVHVDLPLDLVRANDAGLMYDDAVDRERALRYVAATIPTPVHLVFGSRVAQMRATGAAVHDGGHRVSAARLRGDATVPAVMQLSHLQRLCEVHQARLVLGGAEEEADPGSAHRARPG